MPQKQPAPPFVQLSRAPAPHVKAAVAHAAQAKLPDRPNPPSRQPPPLPEQNRPPQPPHVRQALAPAQAKPPAPPVYGTPQARHPQATAISPSASVPRALQGKIHGLPPRVVQPDSIEWEVNKKDSDQGAWMIQQAGVEVRIRHSGTLWDVASHPVHSVVFGGFGNELEGGYTILYGTRGRVTHKFSRSYRKAPRTGKDTEIQLIEDINAPIRRELQDEEAIGVVIEINQKQSICSGCQRALAEFVRKLKVDTGKKVIIRAKAEQRYESRGGRLLEGMQRLQHRGGFGEDRIPHMDANPDGWIGSHNYIAPAT